MRVPLLLSALVAWAHGTCAQEVDVAAAVGRLRSRTNDDAFVVIAEERTNKYVQFSTVAGSLIYDFPVSVLLKPGARGVNRFKGGDPDPPSVPGASVAEEYLSDQEVQRLHQALRSFALDTEPTYLIGTNDLDEPVGWMRTIRGVFTGSDADAARFVEVVFREVYRVDSPYEVTLDEN